jgi:hypothetical protein
MYSNHSRSTLDGELALIAWQARRGLARPRPDAVAARRGLDLARLANKLARGIAAEVRPDDAVGPTLRGYPYAA